jgi:hypothetical protein
MTHWQNMPIKDFIRGRMKNPTGHAERCHAQYPANDFQHHCQIINYHCSSRISESFVHLCSVHEAHGDKPFQSVEQFRFGSVPGAIFDLSGFLKNGTTLSAFWYPRPRKRKTSRHLGSTRPIPKYAGGVDASKGHRCINKNYSLTKGS